MGEPRYDGKSNNEKSNSPFIGTTGNQTMRNQILPIVAVGDRVIDDAWYLVGFFFPFSL